MSKELEPGHNNPGEVGSRMANCPVHYVCVLCVVVQGVPGHARDSGGHTRVHDQVHAPRESPVKCESA